LQTFRRKFVAEHSGGGRYLSQILRLKLKLKLSIILHVFSLLTNIFDLNHLHLGVCFCRAYMATDVPARYLRVMRFVYCLGKKTCDADEFECKVIFQCIQKSRVQNGVMDCMDETDEGTVITHTDTYGLT